MLTTLPIQFSSDLLSHQAAMHVLATTKCDPLVHDTVDVSDALVLPVLFLIRLLCICHRSTRIVPLCMTWWTCL